MADQVTKTELAEDISRLRDEYEADGLSDEDIADVLQWQAELAQSRCADESTMNNRGAI